MYMERMQGTPPHLTSTPTTHTTSTHPMTTKTETVVGQLIMSRQQKQQQGGGMLRYDMSELWEMGGGAEMWAAEAAERNWSVSLCRVKDWPQLICCALV